MVDPLFRAILSSATDFAIITMDTAGAVTSWNAGAEKILEFSEAEIVGKSGDTFFTPEDRARGVPPHEMETALRDGRAADNRWHMRKDGSRFWGEGVVTPIFDASGVHAGYLKIMRDMTARKRAEAEMFHLAHYDPLTGLANRNYAYARLPEMIATALRHEQMLVLHLVDLDGFKQINDTLGHFAGDTVLQQCAERMRATVRESDFLARLGGDEFLVLQGEVHSPHLGEALASKLLETLSQPFHIDGHDLIMSASIGLTVCPQDGEDPTELMKKADLALYRVKGRRSSGGFRYFTTELDSAAHQRTRDLHELRQAVERRAFTLEYQPVIASTSGRIVSAEALLRCTIPYLASYPVEKLVRLGVESGLMEDIGQWVLMQACTQNKIWQDAGLPDINVSVNFSVAELKSAGVPDIIDSILENTGLHPRYLEIEIAGRQLDEAGGVGAVMLDELRARGISVVLDDFGTGYSTLESLRHLPVNRLKLDRHFLHDIPHDAQTCAIAKAMIDMAHSLNIDVLAEGVESAPQAAFCQAHGCDGLQGRFLSPPLAPPDLENLLTKQQRFGRAVAVS